MNETQYIVTKSQIMNSIESALEISIASPFIISELMRHIGNNVETVLEDDCEEMTDDMWERLMI